MLTIVVNVRECFDNFSSEEVGDFAEDFLVLEDGLLDVEQLGVHDLGVLEGLGLLEEHGLGDLGDQRHLDAHLELQQAHAVAAVLEELAADVLPVAPQRVLQRLHEPIATLVLILCSSKPLASKISMRKLSRT